RPAGDHVRAGPSPWHTPPSRNIASSETGRGGLASASPVGQARVGRGPPGSDRPAGGRASGVAGGPSLLRLRLRFGPGLGGGPPPRGEPAEVHPPAEDRPGPGPAGGPGAGGPVPPRPAVRNFLLMNSRLSAMICDCSEAVSPGDGRPGDQQVQEQPVAFQQDLW